MEEPVTIPAALNSEAENIMPFADPAGLVAELR
jgi:hypothetical protein